MIRLQMNGNEVELSSIGEAILPLVTLKKVFGATPEFEMLTSDGRVHPKKEDLIIIVENHHYNTLNKELISEILEKSSVYDFLSDNENLSVVMPTSPANILNKTSQTLYNLGY